MQGRILLTFSHKEKSLKAYQRQVVPASCLFLVTSLAIARDADNAANVASAETVPMIYVVLFITLFIGAIIWFFGYMWWLERKRKAEQQRS